MGVSLIRGGSGISGKRWRDNDSDGDKQNNNAWKKTFHEKQTPNWKKRLKSKNEYGIEAFPL
jgi:hypothetical protein